MHHIAVFCDDLAETIKAFEAEGFPIVLFAAREKGKE
jgi:4-hydroxyphenylpyruvate dioxygenase-like putative hemolysin